MPAMKLSVDQFARDVVNCGLLEAAEIEPLKNGLADGPTQADASELARKLVTAGKLTKYQAANAVQGKAKNLVFGEYVLLAKIGSGGMGDVFKAEHRRMKRVVALKILPPAAVKSPDAVKRFQQEVQAAARLEHPNIVTAHDAGEGHGVHFLVMQYVDGRDLASLVGERGPLPVFRAVNYILQAARGLAYAHSKGVVHRDVKPANLLVNNEGTVKILDMGIAKLNEPAASAVKGNAGLTISGDVMGTADYMSPEQAEDSHQADARCDIYSLGCTFYFLLAGEAPYASTTAVRTIVAHREQPIPSVLKKRPDVSPALERVFARMVAKQPAERFQNMQEVIAALEPFESGGTGTVNAAWAAPVTAQLDSPTSLTMAGAETAAKSASQAPTLLENTVVQKTWGMTAKFMGALFGTVIAPIIVAFLLKYLDKPDAPPANPATATTAATASGLPNTADASLANPATTSTATTASGLSTAANASLSNTTNGSGAATAVKPLPKLDLVPGKPLDLLPFIDLNRDVVHGDWKLHNGVLKCGSTTRHFAILRLPVEPPSQYDLFLTVNRVPGARDNGSLILVFALDDQRGAVTMDFARKGSRYWAIQEVDGKPAWENDTATTNGPELTTKPTPIAVRVRHGRLTVDANERHVFTWHGKAQQLSLPGAWNAVPRQPSLALMSLTEFDISQLAVVPGGGSDWRELWNGVDLKGWTAKDPGRWKVDAKRGVLTAVRSKQEEWLYTQQEYGDFKLRLQFSLAAATNAGVAVRASPDDRGEDHLQIELCTEGASSDELTAGGLHNAGLKKRKKLPPHSPPPLKPVGEWNDLEVDLEANKLRVRINGQQVQDVVLPHGPMVARGPAPAPLKRTRGRIALQHMQGVVRFRDIMLREIKP